MTTQNVSATARHEAGHVAGQIMTGRVPLSATADWPDPETFGSTTRDFAEHGVSHESTPDLMVDILLGPIAEGRADWPPEWPLAENPSTNDARQLAVLANYLDLDEPGYLAIADRARRVATEPDFHHLVGLVAYALELKDELTAEDLRRLIPDRLLAKYGIETEATCNT